MRRLVDLSIVIVGGAILAGLVVGASWIGYFIGGVMAGGVFALFTQVDLFANAILFANYSAILTSLWLVFSLLIGTIRVDVVDK